MFRDFLSRGCGAAAFICVKGYLREDVTFSVEKNVKPGEVAPDSRSVAVLLMVRGKLLDLPEPLFIPLI